jgi:hypothetical protein
MNAVTGRSTVVAVPLHSDTIHAVQGPDGKVQVVIRRICENLGVAYQPQLEKLKGYH